MALRIPAYLGYSLRCLMKTGPEREEDAGHHCNKKHWQPSYTLDLALPN